MEKFRDTNADFYKNLKRGKVESDDFERYIYGKDNNSKMSDLRDELEGKANKYHAEIARKNWVWIVNDRSPLNKVTDFVEGNS